MGVLSLLLILFIGFLVALVLDWLRDGPLWQLAFALTSPLFVKYPRVLQLLGVKEHYSDSWRTDRDHAVLPFSWFSTLLSWTGMRISYRIGDPKCIKALKKRQRTKVEDFKLVENMMSLVGCRLSFDDLERALVAIWVRRLPVCYSLPPAEDPEALTESMLCVRRLMLRMTSNAFTGFWYGFRHWKTLSYFSHVYQPTLDPDEQEMPLFVTPFLTTIDTTLLTLLDTQPIEDLSEVFRHAPVNWVPVTGKGGTHVLHLRNNGAPNASNTIFGTRGFVCPGNMVTFEILRGLKEMKRVFDVEVEGLQQVKLDTSKTLTTFQNREGVYITLRLKKSNE